MFKHSLPLEIQTLLKKCSFCWQRYLLVNYCKTNTLERLFLLADTDQSMINFSVTTFLFWTDRFHLESPESILLPTLSFHWFFTRSFVYGILRGKHSKDLNQNSLKSISVFPFNLVSFWSRPRAGKCNTYLVNFCLSWNQWENYDPFNWIKNSFCCIQEALPICWIVFYEGITVKYLFRGEFPPSGLYMISMVNHRLCMGSIDGEDSLSACKEHVGILGHLYMPRWFTSV